MNIRIPFRAILGFSLLLGALPLPLLSIRPALAATPSARSDASRRWAASIVTAEVVRRQYDYFQPWARRVRTVTKQGLVIGPREILSTAEDLSDVTLIRVQRDGRGGWVTARITWVDYHANLALLTTDDETFWKGLKPARLASPVPLPASAERLQILRWRNGNLESRRMEFNQFATDDAKVSAIPTLHLELSSEVNGLGWGEPIVCGESVVGLAASQSGNTTRAIPSSFVKSVLDARRAGHFAGLGYIDFTWQPAENPDTLRFLGLSGPPRGVVIIDVPTRKGIASPLKPRDVLLKIDGFDVDIDGYYNDPDYGHLIIESLPARRHFAGDALPLLIWRDGSLHELTYKLPQADFGGKILPEQEFNQEPEYLIAGGLVFQPLTEPLLRSWGDDWRRRAPFRLTYYKQESAKSDHTGIVIVSNVLADPLNLGYQDIHYVAVDEVNGRRINKLKDLEEAFKNPSDGFHRIQFMKGDGLQRVVLDAAGLEPATRRVLQRYGILTDRMIRP